MATQPASTERSTIERDVTIAARPETVFPYFTDPLRMIRWMGRTAELDPLPGGTFRIDYNGADIVSGTFVEVEPPRRLVLTWGWEAPGDATPPGSSTVEITLEPDGAGGTRLRLRHSGLPPEAVDGHTEGWDQFLPGLATAVEDEVRPGS